MHLKTPLALSLALLLGSAPGLSEARPSRKAPASKSSKSSKAKARKAPPDEKSTPAPDDDAASADAPVKAQAPESAPAAAPEPAPAPLPPPPPAWAGRVAVLAIPANPGSAEAASRVEADLRGALGTRTDVQLVDLAALFPPLEPASLLEGDALFNEGKNLYDNLDPEAAAKKFIEAAAFYERNPAATKAERLGRVYIFLGASQLLNGDTTGAQKSFTRAQLALPGIEPESQLFGQDVHDAFAEARKGLSGQPRGTLAIDSTPVGAQVLLHGEAVGTTPLKDVELAAGPHQVVLTLPGHAPFGAFQEVASGKSTPLRATLEPTPELAAVQKLAAQASTPQALRADKLPPEAASLSEKLGARYVVLASVKQDRKGRVETELHAWDVQTKNRLRRVELESDDPRGRQQALNKVHAFLTGQLVPSAPTPIVLPEVMKKPWFWAAVGGVAAATTAGILLANQPASKPLGPRLGNPGAGW